MIAANQAEVQSTRHCERDDQKAAHSTEVFSGTISGSYGVSKLMEGCETGLLEEAGRCPEEVGEELQSNSADIGDVQMIRIMYLLASGEGKRARKVEESAYWWNEWDKLPTLASNGDELATKTLGLAGRKESCDETRNGGETDNVLGKRGYQDGVRRGKPEARGPRSWTIPIHIDGSSQLSCVRCRG